MNSNSQLQLSVVGSRSKNTHHKGDRVSQKDRPLNLESDRKKLLIVVMPVVSSTV